MINVRAVVMFFMPVLAACAGNPPATLGPSGGALPPCPDTPNCVHTGSEQLGDAGSWTLESAWVRQAKEDAGPVLEALEDVIEQLPRTKVIRKEIDPSRGLIYLHAESQSRIFRFVDDLEVLWTIEAGALVVRSASRLGHSDLGVNADRVAELRERLEQRGILRANGAPPEESTDGAGSDPGQG